MKLLILCTLFLFYVSVSSNQQDRLDREVDKLVRNTHVRLPFAPDHVFPHQIVENYGLKLIMTNSSRIVLRCRRRGHARKIGHGRIKFRVYVKPLKFVYHYHAHNYGMQVIGTVTGHIKGLEYEAVYDKKKKKGERTKLKLVKEGKIDLTFKHGNYIAKRFLDELRAAVWTGVRFAAIKKEIVV